ncbi:MAG: hypothetical protein ACI35S_04685 [Anaeroplasma sp.]
MSTLSFLFKSKKEMSKDNTKPVKVGKFTISSHAQNRIVEPARRVTKSGVVSNLVREPLGVSRVKYDDENRPSYNRVGNSVVTSINPDTSVVASVRRTNKNDAKKYNLRKKGMVNMQKISDKTIELILNEALGKLGFTLPLSEEAMMDIIDYFWEIEGTLANAKECYNEKIDEEYLKAVCGVVTELSNEDIDLGDLNARLMARS